MTFVFYVSRPIVFENQCGSAEKNKQTTKKINTVLHRGNAKCDSQEAFARGTIDDTIDEKQLISNRPRSRSAAKNKKRMSIWADIFCRFFEFALPHSPDQWARTHRHSEQTCAREWSSDCRTSSSFFSVKVYVFKVPTKANTKNFFRDFSLETRPWIHHDESRSYSNGPNKSDRPGYRDGTLIQLKTGVPPKTTLKLTNLPSPSVFIIYCCFALRNLSLLSDCRTVLAMSTRTCPEVRISWTFFVCFFLAGGWNQCACWTRNTNKKRRALRGTELPHSLSLLRRRGKPSLKFHWNLQTLFHWFIRLLNFPYKTLDVLVVRLTFLFVVYLAALCSAPWSTLWLALKESLSSFHRREKKKDKMHKFTHMYMNVNCCRGKETLTQSNYPLSFLFTQAWRYWPQKKRGIQDEI